MPIDPLPIIRAYPDHLRERIRRLNRLPVQEERGFVLYWMHHAVRGHKNPAKEHVAGGRMSTRWMDEYAFDDGAQYFTVRDERFERWVGNWVESGIVKRWEGRIRVLRNGDIRPENQEQIRYVGVPGMNSVARHLSESLSIRWGTCVKRIPKEERAIVLFDDKDAQLGGYDALIVSTPPE